MRIIHPVIVRPLPAEWRTVKARIASSLKRANAVKSRAAATRHRGQAENSLGPFLERIRKFNVLDPACGSGNFLYLALHALHDLEYRVQLEAEIAADDGQRAWIELGRAEACVETGRRILREQQRPSDRRGEPGASSRATRSNTSAGNEARTESRRPGQISAES